ncbi:MAG TPA: ABC transporter substrate-binding protein [Deinococcales bacterium]|nr:ABC transporter substrate-binding protein [Deinococcales bacterium]
MTKQTNKRSRRTLGLAGALAAVVVVGGGAYWYLSNSNAQSGPVELTVVCSTAGDEAALCRRDVDAWAKMTGNKVAVVPAPNQSSLHLSVIQEASLTKVPVDVFRVDTIWPGMLTKDLLDLKPYFSQADLAGFFPRLVANDTVDGRLLAIPHVTDAGLLFYRTDLLAKYGYSHPPTSWDELTEMAARVQAGERAAGKKGFWGYVWQGGQYEGLTCDALEWITTYGGGNIVEPDGKVTINNPQAVAALQMARNWIGTISPPNVLSMDEDGARAVWDAGNALFMRNWPYAYGLSEKPESQAHGRFDVEPLPKGPAGVGAATLGGWQLAVSVNTRHPKEAADLVRYMTSDKVEKAWAMLGYNSSRSAVYKDPEVLAANPFYARMPSILDAAVSRPAGVTGLKYDVVSTAFFTAVSQVLNGKAEASTALADLQRNLEALKGASW